MRARAKTPSRRTRLLAILRVPLRARGTGARSVGILALAAAGALVIVLAFAASAKATTVRPLKGTFGSAAQPSFADATGLAVDQSTGDLLVIEYKESFGVSGTLERFTENGEPAPFSALGTNAIDGMKGPGGESCADEPASCDETPGNAGVLTTEGTPGSGPAEAEIAVAPPGAAAGTEGDIYVTDALHEVVDIFAPSGEYIGQSSFGFPCGVAVGPSGEVFVGSYERGEAVYKLEPTAPGALSQVAQFPTAHPCQVAVGAGPSDGYVFAARLGFNGPLVKITSEGPEEGEPQYEVSSGSNTNTLSFSVDPTTGDLYAATSEAVREYDVSGPTEATEVDPPIAVATGAQGVAVDAATGDTYVSRAGNPQIEVFGPKVIVPTLGIGPASDVSRTEATLNGSINPEGIPPTECFFEWGPDENGQPKYEHQAQCEPAPPIDSELHSVHADIAGLASEGATYHFRLVAKNGNGTERSADETLVTAATVVTGPATATRTEAATLNGTLYPEGRQYTDCRFEYGLESAAGFEHEAGCEPEAGQIPANSLPQAVSLSLEGLQPNSVYKFRLSATTSAGTVQGETLTFSTVGPPRITEILARDADQNSATLEATIDPRSFETSYRIEWGSTASYDNVATGTIPPGDGPTQVSARIGGLAPATTYHYRVVADSVEGGASASPDQQVETLDSCGFTDGRCLELVSRGDKGPLAAPGKKVPSGVQIQFQAAAMGSALAYTVESGYPETTAGIASALYLGRRGSADWSSEQLTPPTLVPPLNANGIAANSGFKVLSSDLGCGIVSSAAPLAAGAPAPIVEAGGANLYLRDNLTSSYQLITYLPPVGPPSREELVAKGTEYQVVGVSPDCRRIIFRTYYRYPGIPATNAQYQLYEWDGGTLRNVAVIPGPGGFAEPVPAESIPGALGVGGAFSLIGGESPTDYWRAVSADGSRSVFTAVSRFGGDTGTKAVFLRDAGRPAVLDGTAPATDTSQSETATPNDGNSRYWTASTDGSRVFLTARYGLAANASSSGATSCANLPGGGVSEGSGEGCDLYEYDAAAERLTDLSPDTTDPKGAGVVGVLDASEDGSYVYFAARGRLGGEGRTEAENLNGGTYNIYLAHAGSVRFVRSLGQAEALGGNALIDTTSAGEWTSRLSVDGADFTFESSLGVPGGVPMVYVYSAADGTTVCVSCRRDGRPPFSEYVLIPLIDAEKTNSQNRTVEPIVLTAGGRLYFYSYDPLAPGAIEGDRNLFQWERGQVSLIATEPAGVPRRANGEALASFFGGASADGGDVYFATPQSLTGGAPSGWNVYDARVDGGVPEPAPSAPCDASAEGACNPGGANPPAGAPPTTSTFTGPSNPSAKKHHKKKHHKKKHHKKSGKARRANGNRRAGK